MKYRHKFFLHKSSLHPEGRLPARGVAPSHFRALWNILDCSLPQESGQCLSPSESGHALTPDIDHSLGELLPHQQANQTQAPLRAINHLHENDFMSPHDYRALIHFSMGYSRLGGRLPVCYSPVCRSYPQPKLGTSRDLHALDTPPAFILSQDQTLKNENFIPKHVVAYTTNVSRISASSADAPMRRKTLKKV